MLFKYTTQQIEHFMNVYTDAYSCLLDLTEDKDVKYPSIKYAVSIDEGWREFSLCFHKDREKVYSEMLRPKYKNGNPAFRILGK